MSAQTVRAGNAFVEFFAKDSTQRGLDGIKKRFTSFGQGLLVAGAAMTAAAGAAFAGMGKALFDFAQVGSSLEDASDRTGVAIETLSELSHVALMTDASMEDLQKGILGLQKRLAAAKDGSKSAQKAFADLGLSATTLAGMSPDQQLEAIADALSGISDPGERAAAAMGVLGKSGIALLPMLKDGAEGMQKWRDQAREFNLVMSETDAKNASALADAWDLAAKVFGRVYQVVGGALAPSLTQLLGVIARMGAVVVKFVDDNRELVVWMMYGAAALGALGVAFVSLGSVLVFVGMVLGAIPAIIAAVTTAFAMASAAIAFMLSPIGLIIGAVVALVALLPVLAYVLDQAFNNGAMFDSLIGGFNELWAIASQTIGGITAALMSGNWALAGAIAGAGLNAAFVQVFGNLKIAMAEFSAWMLGKLEDTFGSQFIEVILRGIKWVIDKVNQAAALVGVDTGLNSQGIEALIKSTREGNLQRDAARGVKAVRERVDVEVAEAQGALDVFTDLAKAKDKKVEEKAKERSASSSGGAEAFVEDKRTLTVGATSSAAIGRINQMTPQFNKLEDKLDKSNDLLEGIKNNTEDMGAEFTD